MSTSSLDAWRPQMLSVLRIVTALIFFAHGKQKVLGFPASDFDPAVFSLPWIAGAIELVFGALLIVGLFTRTSAFIASGTMAFAYWLAHAPQNVYPALNGGDAAILYTFVFLYLVVAGPGAWSLDAMLGGERSGARTAEA